MGFSQGFEIFVGEKNFAENSWTIQLRLQKASTAEAPRTDSVHLSISFMFLIIKILRILKILEARRTPKILDPKSLTWKAFLVICD